MSTFQPSVHDEIAINTLRFLAVDMVEAAGCGHPGAPMGQAPMAYLLWTRHLRNCPTEPNWWNRDRFVLSCGHASALIYGLVHLAGYDLSLDELRNFRQLDSKTPGHPEYGHTPGVDTTTGPLGQGISNAVGMAIAEELLAKRFNRDGFELFDYSTWVLASDGDLMEGVASEACSLAGHLGLGKLNVLYDANEVTIDGSTDLSFTEDVVGRFTSYGWHTTEVADGTDLAELDRAINEAKASDRPSLIKVATKIGHGSPNRAGTAKAHGEALGAEETRLTKQNLGWPLEPTFHVPTEARGAFDGARTAGMARFEAWKVLRQKYASEHPELAAELDRRERGDLPDGWTSHLPSFAPEDGKLATRKASGKTIAAISPLLPELAGGSADLTGSNNTWLPDEPPFDAESPAHNFHWGVREHAMGAALNGMALCGGIRAFGGTFLIFSDYMRPSIRLAALMGLPVIYVFTHDSIFLGEDGPTHQPVSQLAALRAIPNLTVLRPADANETAHCWRVALERKAGPSALILTRQSLPILQETKDRAAEGVLRGGYVVADSEADPELLLIATGSEVALALEAHRHLESEGTSSRVVSLPSWEVFAEQDPSYRDEVLPPGVGRRLAIEAASPFGWERYVGLSGDVLGVDTFGASAPFADLTERYGFTRDNVVDRARKLLG